MISDIDKEFWTSRNPLPINGCPFDGDLARVKLIVPACSIGNNSTQRFIFAVVYSFDERLEQPVNRLTYRTRQGEKLDLSQEVSPYWENWDYFNPEIKMISVTE